MKTNLILILLTIILFGCSGKSDKKKTKIKNNEFVEVYEEPRHKLVFENKDFKILDIQIEPNDTTLFHRHRKPMFYISLGWQQSSAQSLNMVWSEPTKKGLLNGETVLDSSYITQNLIHRVTNVGTEPSRLIGILNTSNGLKLNDKANPNQITNKWFHSKRIELNENESLDYQKLEFPTIIINLSGVEIEIINDNKSVSHKEKWLLVADSTRLNNSTKNKIEMIQIEVMK